MNKINWKTRLTSKEFWVAIIPAVLLLVKQILDIFGIEFDAGTWAATFVAIVGSIFAILTIMGAINDPNTKGWDDSERSLGYDKPWDDKEHKIVEDNTSKEEQ